MARPARLLRDEPGLYSDKMLDYEITAAGVAKELRTKPAGFILLDVREPWEYATAHIEGSVLMPMGEVPARAHQELDPEAHIVALCHHGVRSMSVTAWLRGQGFERAQSMQGGIDAWSSLVDPKVPHY